MGVNVNLNLKIMVRIQVLYEVVKQFSSDLGFPEAQEKILKKGIEERQILREVILYYMKDNGKAGSWVSFEIDWEKHQICDTEAAANAALTAFFVQDTESQGE